jgi:NTE family protein
MFKSRLGWLLLIAYPFLSPAAIAQQEITTPAAGQKSRPTIGLVLSGGGARGGAHVGVLRALEELGVSIDVIAGTSIGAVVGGFYASGMSVDQIENVINTIDWDAAFLEDSPRDVVSFRRKRDDDLFLMDERPGLNNRELELPLGVVQGQVIDLILTEQFLPVAHVRDFDNLPIPFRAVAAEITTGDAVVLGSGSLAAATRASMSVPAVIAPIEIDGELLVDGGIAMNLPVEVARELGADIIVAVDIASPMTPREELTSVLAITGQLTNILMRRGVLQQMEHMRSDDILIVPEFQEAYGSASFARMSETIDIGYQTTMEFAQQLAVLASSPANNNLAAMSQTTAEIPLPVINFLRLQNNSVISDSLIERHLRGIALGEPLDVQAVEDAVNRIYGMELYQNVRYELVTDGDETGVEIQLDERSWGPNYLQLGLQFSGSGDEDATVGLSASYLSTRINEMNGEWRATAKVGDEPALFANLHQPFGRQGFFFLQPSVSLESSVVNVFEQGARVAELQLRQATLELAVGRELASWGELRAGVRRSAGDIELEVGAPAAGLGNDFDEGELFARFSIDTLDDLAFPRSGGFSRLEWRGSRPSSLGADAKFDQVSVLAAYAKTWDRYTWLTRFRYDATISGVAPISGLYRLGGFLDLSGFNRNELSGQNAARIASVFYRRINNLSILPAYAGVSVELGGVWNRRSEIAARSSILGGSVFLGVDTPIGPIYAGYGRAEDGVSAVYLFLGRAF